MHQQADAGSSLSTSVISFTYRQVIQKKPQPIIEEILCQLKPKIAMTDSAPRIQLFKDPTGLVRKFTQDAERIRAKKSD